MIHEFGEPTNAWGDRITMVIATSAMTMLMDIMMYFWIAL